MSPPGNLYASTIVRLRPSDPPAATLALVAGIAIEHTVDMHADGAHPPELYLKWPNDLLINEAKTAGILLERIDDAVVIGFGVNIVSAPALVGRTTTNLSSHRIFVTAKDLLETLSGTFERWLNAWRRDGVIAIRKSWTERSFPLGTPMSASLPNEMRIDGEFDGLDADGALILRLADGGRRVIHAGDVFLI